MKIECLSRSQNERLYSLPLCVCAWCLCVCRSPLTSLPPQSGFRRQFCESKWDNKTTWQRQYNTAILLIVNKPKFSHFANCFASLGEKHRKVERKKEAQIESIIIKHANIGSAANFFQRREEKIRVEWLNSINLLAHTERQLIITPSIWAVSRCLPPSLLFSCSGAIRQSINARWRHLSSSILK